MRNKILGYLIVALVGASFLLQIGTIGALERETIEFGQYGIQMGIAYVILLVAILINRARS